MWSKKKISDIHKTGKKVSPYNLINTTVDQILLTDI